MKALDYLAGGGPTIAVNVGTGTGSSVFDVVTATERITGTAVPFDVVDRRPGDPVATFADPTFAESTLGWRARFDLDDIIQTAYDWHRSQI